MDAIGFAFVVVSFALFFFFCNAKQQKHASKQKFRAAMEETRIAFKKDLSKRMQRVASKEPSKEEEMENLRTISSMLTHGVPDTYDGDTLIPGVEPDHGTAIRVFIDLIRLEESQNIETILDLASLLYTSETHKNLETSKKLYQYVYDVGNPVQAAIAIDRLDQIRAQQRSDTVNFTAAIQGAPAAMRDRAVEVPVPPIVLAPLRAPPPLPVVPPPVRNDSQNVHDSTLLRTLKETYKSINKDVPTTDATLNEVRNAIDRSGVSDARKENAYQALSRITTTRSHVSALDANEDRILGSVWNTVKGNKDREEALVTELSEMVEHGNVVCATGRATRLVDTMNIINPEAFTVKPKWAVEKEILDKSSVLFQRHVNALPASDRQIFEADVADPKEYERVANTVQTKMKEDLHKEYVEPGLITTNDLNSNVDTWLPTLFVPPEDPTGAAPTGTAAPPN